MIIILNYHGVTDYQGNGIENFQKKHLPLLEFSEQMEYLHKYENLLSLKEVVRAYERGEERNGVVVTFDDAYKNNVTTALPVIERFEIPTTFFLTTGFIDTDRMFWVDQVEYLIDQGGATYIDLTHFDLDNYPLTSQSDKKKAIADIKAAMKAMEDGHREKVLKYLHKLLPLKKDASKSPNYENLTWDDVKRLDASPWIDIGAHTIDHPILTRVPLEEARYQLKISKEELENNLDHSVDLFAYPNGSEADYSQPIINLLKEEGYRCSCTTVTGPNYSNDDLFALKRTMVGFCDAPFPIPFNPEHAGNKK